MFLSLAIFSGIVGLAVVAGAVYTALTLRRSRQEQPGGRPVPQALLRSWTLLDYGLLFLLAFAVLFLFVDLLAVLRDPRLYPDFHIGYLICGFVFVLLHAGLLYSRFLLVLRSSATPETPAGEKRAEPKEAHKAE